MTEITEAITTANNKLIAEKNNIVSPDHNEAYMSLIAPTFPETSGYYRSNTFISKSGTNSLIAAAAPLFALLDKLDAVVHHGELHTLQKKLIHEIRAFESNAQNYRYNTNTILIARFALTATIDQTISKSKWGCDKQWNPFSLLNYFHENNPSEKQFFQILTLICQHKSVDVSLLEFIYFCISLGFEGSYTATKASENTMNRELLNKMVDELYRTIRNRRGGFNKTLLVSQQKTVIKKPSNRRQRLPLSVYLAIAIGLIGSLYFGINYLINIATKPFLSTQQQSMSQHHYGQEN